MSVWFIAIQFLVTVKRNRPHTIYCWRWLLLFTTIVALSGCSRAPFYTGDGKFTDNGFIAYSRRYVIDLGPINLSVPGTYSYKLSGLPHAEFSVAIRIFEEKNNTLENQLNYPASVRMHLRNAEGETVILEEGSLNSWVRSFTVSNNISDLYRRGKERDIPLPEGGTQGERLGVKASGGWGTYFYSEFDNTYFLKLEVLSSDKSINRAARLMVVGWDRS